MVDCQIGSLPGKGEPSMRPDLEEEARSSSFPSSFARLGTTHSPSTTLERSPRRRTDTALLFRNFERISLRWFPRPPQSLLFVL